MKKVYYRNLSYIYKSQFVLGIAELAGSILQKNKVASRRGSDDPVTGNGCHACEDSRQVTGEQVAKPALFWVGFLLLFDK
jgi:hypothetical protein